MSGKDTCAALLAKRIETPVVYLSFADPLKKSIMEFTSSPPEYFYNRSYKEKRVIGNGTITPREIMVWYGKLMRDNFGECYWVNKMKEQIDSTADDATIIITDVRFLEEVKMLDSIGAKLIYVDRDNILPSMKKTDDISERVVYDTKEWMVKNAKDYNIIDNNVFTFDELSKRVIYIDL